MTNYENAVNKLLKRYDPDLFLSRDQGVWRIMRKSYTLETYDLGGFVLRNLAYKPVLICPLTHNWRITGKPVEWGLEPLWEKLQKMDFWTNKRALEELELEEERQEEAKKRSFRNKIEDFWYETHDKFKKSTNDVLTHSMDKKKPLRNELRKMR